MAKAIIKFDLSGVIETARQAIGDVQTSVRSKRISDFTRRAINEGMDASAQRAFWEAELQRERDGVFPLQDRITEANDKITEMKKLERSQAYGQTYQKKLNDLAAKQTTNDAILSWLEQQQSSAVDQDMRETISKEIETTKKNIQTDLRNDVSNLITAGSRDKSVDILTNARTKADAALAKAIAVGDVEGESYWKDQKSLANQGIAGANIQNALNGVSLKKIQGYSPIEVLSGYNEAISKSTGDVTLPVFVDGVKYDNAQAYATLQRDSYLADEGANGFFAKIDSQNSDFLETQAKRFGAVPEATLDSIASAFQKLAAKPELQPYLSRLENLKSSVLAKGVDSIVKKVTSTYTTDYKLQNAMNSLQKLSKKYGIDTQQAVNTLISDMADKKSSIVNSIVQEAASMVGANPSLKWEVAVDQASKAYLGGIIAPNDLVKKTTTQIATEAKKRGQTQVKSISAPVAPKAKVTTPKAPEPVIPAAPIVEQTNTIAAPPAQTPQPPVPTARQKYEAQGYKYVGDIKKAPKGKKLELKEGSYYYK